MGLILLLIAIPLRLVLSTAVLAGALLVTGEEEVTKESLLKCLGISALALMFSFIPFVGWAAGLVWLVAVMVVFEKDLLPAILIALACWAISLVVGFGLGLIFGALPS